MTSTSSSSSLEGSSLRRLLVVFALFFSLSLRAQYPVLVLNVPGTQTEGAALTSAGFVSVDTGTNHSGLTVNLFSSNTNRVQVPPSIIIPPGTNSARFDLVLPDNDWIDGAENVFLEAWLDAFTGDFDVIRVNDNESLALAITLPAEVGEGQGTLTNAGEIFFSGRTVTNVVLALQSNHPELIQAPLFVTNFAGQISVPFHLFRSDDAVSNLINEVRITASAPGFFAATGVVHWLDDEPFVAGSPAPSDQAAQVPLLTTLRWTVNPGAPPGTQYEVYFGTSPMPGAAEFLGSTSSNAWTLPPLAAAATYYWQIRTRTAAITPGPVWSFTTRGVDHFDFDAVPSPQLEDEPFAITITARDELNRTMTHFSGPAALSVMRGGDGASNTILASPAYSTIYPNATRTVGYSFTPRTNILVTAVRHYFGTKVSIWTEDGTLLAAQPVTELLASWRETPLAAPLLLNAGVRYRVSCFSTNLALSRNDGATAFPAGVIHQSYSIAADAFPGSATTDRWWLVDLRYSVSVPFSPTSTGSFTNGIWSGNIIIEQPTTNTIVRVDDAAGDAGHSNPFRVLPSGQPLTLLTQPVSQAVGLATPVSFSVSVDGVQPVYYQWRRDGVNLADDERTSGTTGPVLTIAQARESDSGIYSVLVSNSFAVLASSNALLTVHPVDHFSWTPIPTQMTGQPFTATFEARDYADQLVTNFAGPVTVNASATGWNPHSILAATNHTDSSIANVTYGYSFTPNTNLTVTGLRHYFGTKVSLWTETGLLLASQLVTNAPGTWAETPLATPVVLLAGSTYRVAAYTGGNGSNAFWRTDGPGTFAHGTMGTGWRSGFDNFPFLPAGEFRWTCVDLRYQVGVSVPATVQIADAAFNNGTWTGVVTAPRATNMVLQVSDGAGRPGQSNPFQVIESNQPPFILTHPVSQFVQLGTNIALTVSAVAPGSITWQWQRDGINLTNGGRFNGATSPVLSIVSFQPADGGHYRAVASNEFGSAASAVATLTMDYLSHFTWIAGSPHKIINQPFAFSVQARNSSNQFIFNCPPPSIWSGTSEGGVTVTPIVSGNFSNGQWVGQITITRPVTNLVLRAADAAGRFGLSSPLHVAATSNQGPLLLYGPSNQVASVGSTVRFSADAYGSPTFFYSWNTNNVVIQNVGRFSGNGTTTLTISNVVEADAKTYGVIMGNGHGPAVGPSAQLTVYRHDHFIWQPIASPQSIYRPVPVRLEARDISNQLVANFTGVVSLSASLAGSGTPVSISPVISSNFIAGVWNGAVSITGLFSSVVLRATDALGQTGVSAPFDTQRIVAFSLHPTNQFVLPGTNVTLTALAAGTGTVRYQWRFEGTNIPNATNASYSFTGANLTNYHGTYSVVASDDLGSVTSSNAFVYVLVKPGVVSHIQPLSVLQGASASFTLVATGAPPLTYRWVRNGTPYTNTTVPRLVISNVQASANFRVIITNAASAAGVFSPGPSPANNVALTMLPDFDGDGVSDAWETQFGFSTNNAADALLDFDGDGMSNRDEYIAGTNPTNAASALTISLTTTNAITLRFVAQSNVAYSVQQRFDLSSPSWITFTTLAAQNFVSTVQVTVPNSPPAPEQFFRVVTPPLP